MQWIRENLFLTSLVGILVVCCAAGVFVRMSQDSAFVEEDMKPRKTMADQLASIGRSKPLNKAWITSAETNLEKLKKQRDEVVKESAKWNSQHYKVLQLTVVTGGAKETLAAFPYDPAAYLRKDLTLKFTTEYRRTLYTELARLDLTAWPTAAEIGELTAEIQENIISKRRAAKSRVDFATKGGDAASAEPAPRRKPKPGEKEPDVPKPEGVSQEDWDLSRLSDEDVRKRAVRDATEELTLQKAKAGAMYVSPETLAIVSKPNSPGAAAGPVELDVIFPKEVWKTEDAPAPKLWQAQINLWVTRDILTAVDAANQQSLRKRGGGILPATVPNAAIKQLLSIVIDEEYIDAAADKGLTERHSTTEYEVVEYELTLVMNTEFLRHLMRHLMRRGDHTIKNVNVAHIPVGADGTRYYGIKPVAKVTIAADVLFRADWTRPELMPVETLKNDLAGVLRPEDRKRIEKKP